MNRIKHIRRLASTLAGLACTLLAAAAAAPAAFAIPPPSAPPGGNKHPPLPSKDVVAPLLGPNRAGYPPLSHVRIVTEGGMPGWQIALIAVAAAVLAAAVAVLLDRARATRRHQPAPSA
jgi:hypothetical protein